MTDFEKICCDLKKDVKATISGNLNYWIACPTPFNAEHLRDMAKERAYQTGDIDFAKSLRVFVDGSRVQFKRVENEKFI